MAHEINNPNYYITINGKLLKRIWDEGVPILDEYYEENGDFDLAGIPFSEAHENIDQLFNGIAEGAARIGKIVESLKNFARQDTGELNQQVDVNAVVESATVIMNNLLQKSTNHFSVERAQNLPTIRGNAQQLEQVLINLITNSCHALLDKQNSIVVKTAYDADSDNVTLTIRDDGTGIAPEDLKRIMDPFFTTRPETGGTGLGLSVSYGIIKAHGGELSFDSELGKGTTATVSLPVVS
ncbi:ATP-binding protein [Candidatus Poribacteria bacterium]|nr:ATP-binding protein [Candidatus Poribacteria bacterium]